MAMVVIPFEQLKPDTLAALIEDFVTRDGSVQGHNDVPLDRQVAAVLLQLRAGKAVLVFDEDSGACGIVAREDATGPERRGPERGGQDRRGQEP